MARLELGPATRNREPRCCLIHTHTHGHTVSRWSQQLDGWFFCSAIKTCFPLSSRYRVGQPRALPASYRPGIGEINLLFRQWEQRERARSLVLSQHPLLTRKGRRQRAGPLLPPPGLQNWSRMQRLAPLQPLWNHERKAKTTSFSPLLCSQTYLWPPQGFRTYEKFK